MSLAVLRVPLGGSSPLDRDAITPLCGMLVRERDGDACWVYVAPHAFDHPIFQLIESVLVRLRIGPRIALAMAMKLTNANLDAGRHDSQIRALQAVGVGVTMCGEHHWRCELSAHLAPHARLLAWSGHMNSWSKVVRTILPQAEELHRLCAPLRSGTLPQRNTSTAEPCHGPVQTGRPLAASRLVDPRYSAMALLVCLGAAATAYSATQVPLITTDYH